ncbi:MAG: bifunctional 2-polyprenyl-6-hydroxyphenol methylase/3-demethylubiquinol 3-O-methyltransferase UbiG [Gammaproteobacteria bacterium]|nr:bifunctional 2-polyprenyl-6-hydroxyphenol methylase/3-demethylubiquinol 3-O-methyltransferase UbiG [Gammaproteobacteria bacterium]NNF61918.1 bifunctional 2-polyprenyl-6-hydroxyphenol methylase/3-demethylubiquinol 3-O-methyltransferase UbiG [Gammaproteobacteria bacterium]NNM19778.1 bifunctional 2-polyprenyl-6-hydroxyphenol methylase/3-demethylubiquinol 3-O-methyltransferase UbiG [Gammaproteobacteria bacterium]
MNVDPQEISNFEQVAGRWWEPEGEFAPLHAINPLRTGYIAERAELAGSRLIDIGCGGGLLCESVSRLGAIATGIDMSGTALAVARQHAAAGGLTIDYQETTAEQAAAEQPSGYDVVTCLEMLEHVPDPAGIVQACVTLAKPGGNVFFSTINRNPKAWLLAVVGAEYVLNMIPRGTHDYTRFIRPSELEAWARAAGLELRDITGLHYNPLTRRYTLGSNVDVNYLMHLHKPASPSR